MIYHKFFNKNISNDMIKNQQFMKSKQMKKQYLILFFIFLIFSDFIYCQNEIKILDKRKFFFYPKKTTERGRNKYIKVKISHINNEECIDTNKYKIIILDKNNKKVEHSQIGLILRRFDKCNKIITKKIYIKTKKNYTILSMPYYLYQYNSTKIPTYSLTLGYGYSLSGKYKLYVTYRDAGKTHYSDTIPLYVW